ncbi:uncharacterized protein [Amphiura filiformis]|uniref:uncharacterized protein n=1 Tax=Amphiura filiformis TaxID=82378 RepID=UPI003B21BB77
MDHQLIILFVGIVLLAGTAVNGDQSQDNANTENERQPWKQKSKIYIWQIIPMVHHGGDEQQESTSSELSDEHDERKAEHLFKLIIIDDYEDSNSEMEPFNNIQPPVNHAKKAVWSQGLTTFGVIGNSKRQRKG